jgi:sialidase-1
MSTLPFLSILLCLTSSGNLVATLTAPIETDVFVSGTEGYHTFRIAAIVVTNRGTILAICEGRRGSTSDM